MSIHRERVSADTISLFLEGNAKIFHVNLESVRYALLVFLARANDTNGDMAIKIKEVKDERTAVSLRISSKKPDSKNKEIKDPDPAIKALEEQFNVINTVCDNFLTASAKNINDALGKDCITTLSCCPDFPQNFNRQRSQWHYKYNEPVPYDINAILHLLCGWKPSKSKGEIITSLSQPPKYENAPHYFAFTDKAVEGIMFNAKNIIRSTGMEEMFKGSLSNAAAICLELAPPIISSTEHILMTTAINNFMIKDEEEKEISSKAFLAELSEKLVASYDSNAPIVRLNKSSNDLIAYEEKILTLFYKNAEDTQNFRVNVINHVGNKQKETANQKSDGASSASRSKKENDSSDAGELKNVMSCYTALLKRCPLVTLRYFISNGDDLGGHAKEILKIREEKLARDERFAAKNSSGPSQEHPPSAASGADK